MLIEPYEPPELYEVAQQKVIAEMLRCIEMFERGDLEGLFKRFDEGGDEDEI